MYANLIKREYDKELKIDAIPMIRSERLKLEDIFEHILDFCTSEGLIISDVDILLNKKEDYWTNMQIYTSQAESNTKKLFSKLCKTFGAKFSMKISEWNSTYYIEYNTKRICIITLLKIYKDYSIDDFVQPVIHTYKKYEIKVLPPLLELISLYENLYNPIMAEEWPSILKNIRDLEIGVKSSSIIKIDDVSLFTTPSSLSAFGVSHPNKKNIRKEAYNKILLKFISDTNYILITDINDIQKHGGKIEIISKNDIKNDVSSLDNYFKKMMPHNNTDYNQVDLFIPNEYSMEKYNVFIIDKNGEKTNILNIYNNTSYQLINIIDFKKNGMIFKIPDPIVVMRFAYITLWKEIIINRLLDKKISHNNKIDQVLKIIEENSKKINIYERKINYIGNYLDLNIENKKKALSVQTNQKNTFYCQEL